MSTTTCSMISFDWAMKRLLRNKANFEVLEGFLSELLRRRIIINSHREGVSAEVISSVTGLTPEQISEILNKNENCCKNKNNS